MISKQILIVFFLLFAQSLIAQTQEEYEADVPSTLLPIPVVDGWTFVGDSSKKATYPIYDSVVFYEWEFFANQPQIVLNKEGFYGLIAVSEKVDTLKAFAFDSLFYFGSNYFGRKNGEWTHWQMQWKITRWELQEKPFGKVERWFRDERSLYFWQNGKIGLFEGFWGDPIPPTYTYCRFFGQFLDPLKIPKREESPYLYCYLVSDGEHFGLLVDRELVIPVVASNIQFWNHGFIRYWQNGWKYLRVSDRKLIDPNGADVRIYNSSTWKIYNSDRTRSTLFINNGSTVLYGKYEDYFLLSDGTIAARKDSSIVLLNPAGQLLFDGKCEQIDYVSKNRYSILRNEKWYLVDGNGKLLSERGFDHIAPLNGSSNRLRVHENNLIGVIDLNGKLIYSTSYSEVFTNGTIYLLENEQGFAVGTANGEFLSKHLYQWHYYLYQNPELVVMYNALDRLDIYSPKTKLNSRPVNLFFCTDGVVKCYEKEGLELVVLESDLSVLERIFYPVMSSMEVGKMPDEMHYVYDIKGYKRSHLEEHQLSGYYGYRFNWNTKHVRPPHFKEVEQNVAFGLDFCVETYADEPFSIDENLPMMAQNRYQVVNESGGTYQWEPMLSSTLPMESAGGSTSANRLMYFGNGHKEWVSEVGNQDHNADEVVYIHYNAQDLFTYNIGGNVVPTTDLKNSFSVFEYIQRFNLRGNLVMTEPVIEYVMNPANRLKVDGGSWYVNIDYTERPDKIAERLKGVEYASISFYNSWEPEMSTFLAKKSTDNYIWSFQHHDSIVLDRFKLIETAASMNDYYIVTSADAELAKVHPYNPEYVFFEADSSVFYQNGRLIKKSITGWGLTDIAGNELIPPIQDEIRYLNNDFFGLRNDLEWTIIRRDGVALDTRKYEKIQPFVNGYALARLNGTSILLDQDLKSVFQTNASTLKSVGDGFYVAESAGKTILFRPVDQLIDTIQPFEKQLQNGWVYGKEKAQQYIRKLGSKQHYPIKATAAPEVIGDLIIIDKNGLFTILKTDGEPVFPKNKKWKVVEKGEKMLALKSDKEWCFLNLKGELIHSCKKGKSLIYFDHRFVLELQDTTYGLDQFGNSYTVSNEGMEPLKPDGQIVSGSVPEHEIIQSAKGYGVVDLQGNILVEPVHVSILGKQGEEFIVEMPSKKGVYNRSLQPLIPLQFDQVIGYDEQFFLVRKGSVSGICTASGDWFYPMK